MKAEGLGPLSGGGRVVIIGGGPAGTSTAIGLKKRAMDLGQDLIVTIVEGKQFQNGQHHNLCTGVLSPPIIDLLERELEVPFPYHLTRNVITGYVLHTARRHIVLDGEDVPSVSMRRIQFDTYMQEAACERGIEILPARATNLEFHADRVLVYTESNSIEADVVVGAFGLDEGTAVLFNREVGYRPPPTLSAIITKYHPGETSIAKFGNRIHAFLPDSPRIEFGAVTPKDNHLTINIAGDSVDADLMKTFLAAPEVRQVLPCKENTHNLNPRDFRFFKGRFPCGKAREFSGDRYLMVGDASGLVRAFKGKGVTSAVQTGLRAAETILQKGISSDAFRSYHAANRDISGDRHYGLAIRQLTILASRFGGFDAVLQAANLNPDLRRALFSAVSAHHSYQEVIRVAFSPASVRSILLAFFKAIPMSQRKVI